MVRLSSSLLEALRLSVRPWADDLTRLTFEVGIVEDDSSVISRTMIL